MTLSGLSLGTNRPPGIFKLSTSVESGAQEKPAPAIEAVPIIAEVSSTRSSSSAAPLLHASIFRNAAVCVLLHHFSLDCVSLCAVVTVGGFWQLIAFLPACVSRCKRERQPAA
jgi:hypothetical protein